MKKLINKLLFRYRRKHKDFMVLPAAPYSSITIWKKDSKIDWWEIISFYKDIHPDGDKNLTKKGKQTPHGIKTYPFKLPDEVKKK